MNEVDASERVRWVDWLMVGLALLSVLMLIVEQAFYATFAAAPAWRFGILGFDLAVCALFGLELAIELRRASDKWHYLKSHWYDVLGMIPIAHPMLRSLRLLRLVRMAVLSGRLVRAHRRSFGDALVAATVLRFREVVVDALSGAVVLRGLGMVEPVLVNARIAERVGELLEGQRREIHLRVQQRMEVQGVKGQLLQVGPVRNMVNAAVDAAVDAAILTLRSEEANHLVQETTRLAFDEMRLQIHRRDEGAGPET